MRILGTVLLAAVSMAAAADSLTSVGETTDRALAMQRDGEQSAPVRPMLKEAAERTYERYLKSFEYPIPEFFEEQSGFGSGQ